MDIVVNFLFALFLMSLAGSVLLPAWSLFRRLFGEACGTPFLYYGLRIVLLALLLPVMYIGLFLRTFDLATGEMDGSSFLITQSMREWAMVLGGVWLAGAAVSVIAYTRKEALWRRLRKKESEAGNEWVGLLEQCRVQMGIRCPVKLYMLEWAPTSFTSGARKPAIWLPAGYGKAEYEMMLFHELAHIRHRDVFWNRCLQAAWALHWFNPIVKHLARQVDEWEEYYADDTAMAYVADRKAYGNLLLDQSRKEGPEGADPDNRLFFARKIAKERIRKMFREERGRRIKRVSGIAATCFLCIGVFGVGCVTSLAAGARNIWFFNTMEVYEEEYVPFENTLEERTFDASELEGYTFEEEDPSEENPLGPQSFTWTVGTKTTRLSNGFSVTAGESIAMLISVMPENKDVQVGIRNPDGTYAMITGSEVIHYSFLASQTGTYKVIVINSNSASVEAEGGYYAH